MFPDLREAQMMVTSLLALRCCFSEETHFILFECLNNTATPITYQLYPTTNAQAYLRLDIHTRRHCATTRPHSTCSVSGLYCSAAA